MSDRIFRGWFRSAFEIMLILAMVLAMPAAALRGVDAPANLQPVPDAAMQAGAMKVLKDVFKPFPPERADDKAKVAKKLLEQSGYSGNDAATEFVLLQQAAELSSSAGDIPTAMQAVDGIAQRFAVDAGAEKLLILTRTKGAHLNATSASAATDAALQVCAEAMHKGDFDLAGRAAGMAGTFARQTQDAKLTSAAQTLGNDVRKAQAEAGRAAAAEEKLKTQPADPAACLTVGRYLCCWRGDWEKGLPLLARGSDAALKSAAAADLAAPTDPEARFKLAEQWVALATHESGPPLVQIRQHAAALYEQALPGSIGLQKALIEKRLAEFHADASQHASFASKERALTRLLNDPAHWKATSGMWKNEPGKLHGEGDSSITFDTPIPRDIVFSFHINVLKGMRPRMLFEGTGMMFGNEGFTTNLFPHGATLAVKKPDFLYKNNEPHLLRFKLSGDHFEIEIDQEPVFAGTYKSSDEPFHLRFQGGDGYSAGTTEYYGFEVESLPAPTSATP